MPVILKMEPKRAPVPWRRLCSRYPRNSIALDGYVSGGPRFNLAGPYANFDHHSGVDRLTTRATCSQVLLAIRQGLFTCFKGKIYVWANDCDEDVCLAVFLLRHPKLAARIMSPRLNRLVSMEGLLDSTAGAYPFPIHLRALEELAWVFHPYRQFRTSGGIDRKDPDEFAEIIDAVGRRISRYLNRTNGRLPLDTRYKRIGGGKGWTMIREIGAHGRTGAFADGIRAYMSVRDRPDGRRTVTIGRMSIFVDFPTWRICKKLNRLEGTTRSVDRWGGADNIIVSPRVKGTRLSLKRIAKAIDETIGG